MKWIAAFLFASLVVSNALAEDCPVNEHSSTAELLTFIDRQRSKPSADGRCVGRAFLYLSHDTSNLNILLGYLDYKRPQTLEERNNLRTLSGPGGWYPAIAALAQIGQPAIPGLLLEIKSSDSETVRKNAAYTLHMIFPLCGKELHQALQKEIAQSVEGAAQQEHLREAEENIDAFRRYKKCETLGAVDNKSQ